MRARGFQLGRWTRWGLYSSLGLLFTSGCAWLIGHYLLAKESDFGVEPSLIEPLSLTIHGTMVPVFLVVFGAILPTHVARAFKARRNLTSGLAMLGVAGILIVTGYFLYYAGDEGARSVASVGHTVLGVALAPILIGHVITGKRSMNRPQVLRNARS